MVSKNRIVLSCLLVAVIGVMSLSALAAATTQSQSQAPADHAQPLDDIQLPFCYISNDWARPNTTIWAVDRATADKKGSKKGLVYCRRGACEYEGKLEPVEERCD